MHDNSHRTPDEFNDDINLEDEDEMEEWCRLFECSAAELRAAIKVRGPSAKRVRAHLRDRQQAAQ